MNQIEAEAIVSDPESSVEKLAEAYLVLNPPNSDASQAPPVAGTAAGSVVSPATPAPSTDTHAGASLSISSAIGAPQTQQPSTNPTKKAFLTMLRSRGDQLPHGDRPHVDEIIRLLSIDPPLGDEIIRLLSIDPPLGDDLTSMMEEVAKIETSVRYRLRQLQGDGGFIEGHINRIFRA